MIRQNRDAIGEGIYLLYFAVMIGARALGLYEGMLIYNITLVVGMLLFACKMLVTKHTIKEYVVAACFLALAGMVYLHTGEKGLLVCFTMMLGMKRVAVQKVIRTGIIVAGIAIAFKIFTGVFGLASEIYYPQEREGIGMMFRHSLGYAHPNTLHMNVLMLTMLVAYYLSNNLRARDCKAGIRFMEKDSAILLGVWSLALLAFNFYIFRYSGSRTGALTSVVFLVINFWFFMKSKPGFLENFVCYISFPAVCFLAIGLPFLLPEGLFDLIDKKLFTTRLSIARYFWSNNSISLWGIRLVNPDEAYRTYGIDMAQLYLFLQLGIVAFIVMSCLTIWFVYYCLKRRRMQELAVLLGMLCLGIWEPLLYNLGFKNFIYVFMGAAIYEFMAGHEAEEMSFVADRWTRKITIRAVMKSVAFGFLAGIFGMLVFLVVTARPGALYGSRQLDESGRELGMTAYYYTQEEIHDFKASGDIVVGYVDQTTPMYIYDEDIASGEYTKKAMSIAVFTAIFVALLYLKCGILRKN